MGRSLTEWPSHYFRSVKSDSRLAHNAFDLNCEAMRKRAAIVAEFDPKFYTAGPTRFYLPLLQDIVTLEKPELIVTFGFSDGQVHLAMCQIATENSLSCRIVAVRRAADNESAEQGPTWTHGLNASANSYSAVSKLLDGDSEILARRFDDHS